MGSALTIVAPAKVNLHLGVGGLRADGYHEVDTVLQAIDLWDTITMEPSSALELVTDTDLGVPPEENLVWRAVVSLASVLGRPPALRVSLSKRIPHGAGLGGGSSDAAAALAGAARVWGIDPTDPVLHITAASLGADVPFFLDGGTALFGGRGDERLGALPTIDAPIVLVRPPVSISTAQAYRTFDSLGPVEPRGSTEVVRACASGDVEAMSSVLFNNMTEAVVSLEPVVQEAIAWVEASDGVLGALMAGSGSCVFGICGDSGSAARIASSARDKGWWAQATRTRRTGVQVTPAEGR